MVRSTLAAAPGTGSGLREPTVLASRGPNAPAPSCLLQAARPQESASRSHYAQGCWIRCVMPALGETPLPSPGPGCLEEGPGDQPSHFPAFGLLGELLRSKLPLSAASKKQM